MPKTDAEKIADGVRNTEKRIRKSVELPTSVICGTGEIVDLSQAELPELAILQGLYKSQLSEFPRIELGLKAINAAIRKAARNC